MRTLRLSLMGVVVFMLLGGQGGAVLAQAEDESASQPLSEFTGRMECHYGSMGALQDVVVASTDEGDFIRREWRGPFLSIAVREISDPRLEGSMTSWFNSDEYVIASDETPWQLSDVEPDEWPQGVMAVTMRLSNADGSWQGSGYANWYVNGDHSTITAVLTGGGAYEGQTAVMEMDFDELNPVCAWDVHGYLIEGDLPPTPEPPAE